MRAKSSIGVIGLGYVGVPVAFAYAQAGFRVAGVDLNADRVRLLAAGRSYIDDITDEDVQLMLSRGALFGQSSESLETADCVFICVPTPLDEWGAVDLSHVEAAARTVGATIRPGTTVIFVSTSFPGTTRGLVLPLIEETSGLQGGLDFHLAFSPERTDPGNRNFQIANTPRLVAGLTSQCQFEAERYLRRVCSELVSVAGIEEAEFAKLIENVHRQVNIALANQLHVIGRDLGLNSPESFRAAATKPFGYTAFSPGPGVGGHCIPIDPVYLIEAAKRSGSDASLIECAQAVNARMPAYTANRIEEALKMRGLGPTAGRVLLLGVGYKPGSRDTRNSPAQAIWIALESRGFDLSYHDRLVPYWSPRRGQPTEASVSLDLATSATFDAVVLLDGDPSYRRYVHGLNPAHTIVFDTRDSGLSDFAELL